MEGIFKERINRFIAHILINGQVERVHVANTGRMRELLVDDARVIVRKVDNPSRKTNFDLLHVYRNGSLVYIDSKTPNILLEKAFKEGGLHNFEKDYDIVKREVVYGNSRFDLGLTNSEETVLIEAKCVTLVKEGNLASFPDAPTERGRKHVLELIDAKKNGFRTAVFFIIQRDDAVLFEPNRLMDNKFAEAVKTAHDNGVEFYAYICDIKPNEISIKERIPVRIE